MKKKLFLSVAALATALNAMAARPVQVKHPELTLWYNHPAKQLAEALPLGNGQTDLLYTGTVSQDTLHFNTTDVPNAGRLVLTFSGQGDAADYGRWLDLTDGSAGISYKVDDVVYSRELFASMSDSVVVIRLKCSKKGKLNFRVAWASTELGQSLSTQSDAQSLNVRSRSTETGSKLLCQTYVRIFDTDGKFGKMGAKMTLSDEQVPMVEVKGASYAVIVVGCASDLHGTEVRNQALALVNGYQSRLKSYETALSDHQQVYQKTFGRVSLVLADNRKQSMKDTETRMKEFRTADDPSLAALLFQYGRYRLITLSNPNMPLRCWPAEVCNLGDCVSSLYRGLKNDKNGCDAKDAALLWDHYLYSGNKDWLKEYYPALRLSAEKCAEKLLLTDPLCYDLLKNAAEAARILNTDSELAAAWNHLRDSMALTEASIGTDFWSIYPGRQISPYDNDSLFRWERKQLSANVEKETAREMGERVCQWARLLDGNKSLKMLCRQMDLGGAVSSPDVQLTACAGIAEMLLQSHGGSLHVLPALPSEWKLEGTVRGLCARGGYEIVEMTWKFGRIERLVIRSKIGGTLRLRTPTALKLTDNKVEGAGLKIASDESKNPLFRRYGMASPVWNEGIQLNSERIPETFHYDLFTRAGKTYTLVPYN